MALTTENIDTTGVATASASTNTMARFSIDDHEDEDAPITYKRPRFSEHLSQSRVVAEEDDDDDEDVEWEPIPIEDVESDSQGFEEDEVDDDFEVVVEDIDEDGEDFGSDDYGGDHEAAEPVPEMQIQQQETVDLSLRLQPRALSTPSPVFDNANGELQVVLTDPDVLDCPICLDPLCSPVFQCENGHIACSSCCSKIKRKCASCCMPIGYNRCRAIEKVIESVKTSCKNARYGCNKTMTYSKKAEHEQMCPHSTCYCPHSSCPFANSSKNLYLHFGIQHAASTTRFTYNTTFTLRVELYQKHIFLQEQHESVVFILNHEVQEHGRAFHVDCVGPSMLKSFFVYQLTAKSMDGNATLTLQCVPEVYTKWNENTPKNNYVTVPSNFSGCNGIMSLDVCIKKAVLSV